MIVVAVRSCCANEDNFLRLNSVEIFFFKAVKPVDISKFLMEQDDGFSYAVRSKVFYTILCI